MSNYTAFINIQEGLNRIGGNKRIYSRLLDTFSNDKSFGALGAALEEGDLEKAKDAVHAIKGVAGNLSLTAVYNAAVDLELALKGGNNDGALFDTLREAMETTLGFIAQAKSDMQ